MTKRPDPLQLQATAGEDRPRRRLSRGETAALAGLVFLATLGFGLFTAGMNDSWQYLAGVGWGIVVGLIWVWAERLDG